MARGWDSKSVVDQQAEKLSLRAPAFVPPTSQQQALESLHLQRKRILSELEKSTNPRFIAQQQKSLDFLDRKLEQLSS